MRMTDGAIYLVQPIFGRYCLTGAATIGTTWLDYTFMDSAEEPAGPLGTDGPATPPAGRRVLIPITNVSAIVIGPDDGAGSALP